MKGQANQQVAAAGQLTNNAFRLLQGAPSVENRRTALSLLVEAGRLFEQAAMTYKALVPQYATQTDVENSLQAMQKCIQTISEIKASL